MKIHCSTAVWGRAGWWKSCGCVRWGGDVKGVCVLFACVSWGRDCVWVHLRIHFSIAVWRRAGWRKSCVCVCERWGGDP